MRGGNRPCVGGACSVPTRARGGRLRVQERPRAATRGYSSQGLRIGSSAATSGAARASSICARSCAAIFRSEEHTSELQSLMRISYAVFCLKKKKHKKKPTIENTLEHTHEDTKMK